MQAGCHDASPSDLGLTESRTLIISDRLTRDLHLIRLTRIEPAPCYYLSWEDQWLLVPETDTIGTNTIKNLDCGYAYIADILNKPQ